MSERPALSVIVLTKDEADNIGPCLDTVAWADELIVYDSGSRDDTVAIARQRGVRVEVDADWQGYGEQRRRAQACANGQWILMLDADERVSAELAEEIRQVVAANELDAVCLLPRLSWCFGSFIRHGGWYPDYVARLYPRDVARYDEALVHEKLVVPAGVRQVKLRGDLLHFTYRDLQHYLVKSAGYAAAWAEQRARRGRRASLPQGLLHGVGCFVRMYLLRGGFLDGRAGLLLALLSAHSTFAKYADLWVRARAQPPSLM